LNCRRIAIIATLVFAALFTLSAPAAQRIPGRLQTAPLITQGPGSDIRATVRELRDTDQPPNGVLGVVVVDVVRDGAAQRAGLMAGDIITQFDRQAVTNAAQFGRIVRDTPPDRTVPVVFLRMGISRETKLTTAIARPQ
jgi:serine protease Do